MTAATEWFEITQVHPQIFAIAESKHWEEVISYLVIDHDQAFLIDTGMGYASMLEAVKSITSLPVTVLLTHAHWDHIGSTHEFENVSVFKDDFELGLLANGFESYSIAELADNSLYQKPFVPQSFNAPGHQNPQLLTDGQVITVSKLIFEVIHTPGHTPGSVCFWCPQLEVLFTGDTLYPGPLYGQLPESHLSDYLHSLKKLQHLNSHNLVLCPGHNAVKAGAELLKQSKELVDQLAQYLDSPSKQVSELYTQGKLSFKVA